MVEARASGIDERLFALREKMLDLFVEKDEAIDAVLAALVSGEPVILVGPPGTAKTQIVETLSKLIDAKYFYYLLTRFTEPDELLGPLDVVALREGRYKRITAGRLPEAEIAFLDEVFKASSAIRNVLLDVILHKRFLNGVEYFRLPLLAIYMASNEVSTDAEDAAFYDRITLRYFGRNVSMESWPDLLTKGLRLLGNQALSPLLKSDDVRLLQAEALRRVEKLQQQRPLLEKYIEVLAELRQRGIQLSDRRKVKTLQVSAAYSVVHGEPEVTPESLADAVRATAPSTEEDLERVEEALMRVGLSSYSVKIRQLQTLLAELKNLCRNLMTREIDAMEAERALSALAARARLIMRSTGDNPRLRSYAKELERELSRAARLLEDARARAEHEPLYGIRRGEWKGARGSEEVMR
ncbi:MAG: AAA family ATPase [Fervidicoccaceae archaeon]